jgi:transcriptional regulator with XRE-family HTH domain
MPDQSESTHASDTDWHLRAWMTTLDVTQAELGRRTGWSKATMNDIFHGRTEYYRAIVNAAADALYIQPYELLMHPDEAMAIRRLRESAVRIAAETRIAYRPEPAKRA